MMTTSNTKMRTATGNMIAVGWQMADACAPDLRNANSNAPIETFPTPTTSPTGESYDALATPATSTGDEMTKQETDPMTGDVVVYYEEDGERRAIRLNRFDVDKYGVAGLLVEIGLGEHVSRERRNVVRDGKIIGSVPWDFDIRSVKSMSPFYIPRGRDFVLEGDVWIADRMLCDGDFEAIPGFIFNRRAPNQKDGAS